MGLGAAAAAAREDAELSIVVIDVPEGGEPMVADVASGMGLPERRVHVRGALTARDRAAVVGSAVAVVASDAWAAFPWRVVEALALGTPVVAVDSPVHREVLLDGGVLAGDADALAEELRRILLDEASARRLRVLAEDRSRSFSWRESAERVWQLHAEL